MPRGSAAARRLVVSGSGLSGVSHGNGNSGGRFSRRPPRAPAVPKFPGLRILSLPPAGRGGFAISLGPGRTGLTGARPAARSEETQDPDGNAEHAPQGARRRRSAAAAAGNEAEAEVEELEEAEEEEELDEEIGDLSRAQRAAQRFRTLSPGDPSFVPLTAFRGSPSVHAELTELVELLKDPARYARVGAKPPKGVLLCGESGTGKTFAARAVASEAQVPFLSISGGDFRQSPFSGVGTSMVLRMFAEAKKRAPCLVFIDEVDSLGEARRSGLGTNVDGEDSGSTSKLDYDSTLNTILAYMDGFDPASGVLFMAATNRPEVLDEALVRSGRFDKRIEFGLPDPAGREDILRGYVNELAAAGAGPDFAALAKQTAAFTPADLQGLVNGAALRAARAGQEAVRDEDFAESLQEVLRRKAKARPEGAFQIVERVDVKFDDVRGLDEAVTDLRDIVDMLVNREKYRKLGGTPPRGVLLDGPPGVGKTHCARALAGEVGLPFLSASGSDFQASRYAGVGTQLVKRLFALARKLQPCVVFIDEIDALGRRREGSARGAEQDRENTLMQLLVELDGFSERSEVLLVAATNRPDVLDPALLRPGRFDRRVNLELPDTAGRQAICELYARGKPLEETVSLPELARRTAGLSGAELRSLLNEAALRAAKKGSETVRREDVDHAADRILIGVEKSTPTRSREARRLTAAHEAGHAILGMVFAQMTGRRVVRASIRPRMGGIGGVTLFEPFADDEEGSLPSGLVTKQGCCATLCVDLAGRVAEEVFLRPLEISSGASEDFRGATRRAMAMVTDWGLGGSVLSLDGLGRPCSDATLREAEKAAGNILELALAGARAVLQSTEGRRCLALATERLLEAEEVSVDELSASMDLQALQAIANDVATKWL